VLALALGVRLYVLATHVYVIHSDETFQYFEQGHRLVFGSGLQPWEFFDGGRSWLLPGIIAGVMLLASWMSNDPMAYILAARVCCTVLSLTVVWVGFRYGQRQFGLRGAVVTGLVCAIWFELIYFAPVVMTEVIATYCIIWAVYLNALAAEHVAPARFRLICTGALYGLAAYLRVQYLPEILLAVLWQQRLSSGRYLWIGIGMLGMMLPLGVVLDTLTWGTPFQSIWLNLVRNTRQGVGSRFGESPWYYFILFEGASWHIAAVLGVFVLLGAWRAPLLSVISVVTILSHSLVPHKEHRFIYLAIAYAPILLGLGISMAVAWIAAAATATRSLAYIAGLLLFTMGSSWGAARYGLLHSHWHSMEAIVQVFLAAHQKPDLCGLGVKGLPWYSTGGYTYLNRAVPLYLWDYGTPYPKPVIAVPLRLAVVLDGLVVPQFSSDEFNGASYRYNYLIGSADAVGADYTPVNCFANKSDARQPRAICLFHRPGGCE